MRSTDHGERQDGRPAAGAAALPGARRGRLPAAPAPQLAVAADVAPRGPGWLYEPKYDGYRVVAALEQGRVRLWSRNARDWTARFPEIAAAVAALPAGSAVLDGEVVAPAAPGTSEFGALQAALARGRTGDLVYQLFDLLYLDGLDLREVPLMARKGALAALLEARASADRHHLRFSGHVCDTDGARVWATACELGLEGVVSKRANAPYRARRSRDWRKLKCARHADLVVVGFTAPPGSRAGFGALLLAARAADGGLVYAGRVGSGFDVPGLAALRARLGALERKACPLPAAPRVAGAHWVQPELVAEVGYREWTAGGRLRQPVFRGIREDKTPADADRAPDGTATGVDATRGAAAVSNAPPGDARPASDVAARASGKPGGARIAGVELTHPDRVLFPEQGLTKRGLAEYYAAVADAVLPGLRRRPLSLLRCPQGHGEACFFQKHPRAGTAEGVPRAALGNRRGTAEWVYVEGLADLLRLVQIGTLELHPWGSRVDDPERPDTLVLDLDPGPGASAQQVVDVARELLDRLDALGLAGFSRTTGGKGLHVVVPIEPGLAWPEARAFTRALAHAAARDDPRRVTASPSLERRRGRVYVDYLRNARGATAIASYSTRARPGAPVAVPVRRGELRPAIVGDRYDVVSVRRRLAALGSDPWAGYAAARRPVTGAMLRALAAAGGR